MKVQIRICSQLYETLSEKEIEGTLHSCFHRAMNIAYENGLVTLLAKEKSLQPFSLNPVSLFSSVSLPSSRRVKVRVLPLTLYL